jgi:hypothetical protein
MVTRRRWIAGTAALLMVRDLLASGQLQKGIYRVRGDARLDAIPAKEGMDVKAGQVVTTAAGAELVFVIDRDAFLVRARSRVEVQGAAGALVAAGLRIVTGAVLSVFATGQPKRISTPTATIGIRGTGIYVESEPAKSYVCTCYGEAEIVPVGDPAHGETVRTTHHEQPRYVMAKGAPQMMMTAPVINHTDAELTFLEGLVGRQPPFAPWPGDAAPRSY